MPSSFLFNILIGMECDESICFDSNGTEIRIRVTKQTDGQLLRIANIISMESIRMAAIDVLQSVINEMFEKIRQHSKSQPASLS